LPNDSETFRIGAEIDRHQNRWGDALANFRKASELDPRNDEVTYHLEFLYREMRRYNEREQLLTRDAANHPGPDPWSQMMLAEIKMDKGDPVGAQTLLSEVPLDFSPTPEIWETRFTAALYLHDYDGASRVIAATPEEIASDVFYGQPSESWADCLIARFRGDKEKAQLVFAAAQEKLEPSRPDKTKNWFYFVRVARLEAGLRRKDDAIRDARRALDLMPIAKDAVSGPIAATNLALVYAWTEEPNLAIEQLEFLAKIPCGPSYGDLRFNPSWDSLRGDPRFEKIVASLAPK
jgi:tetratricopeptide (TPR) repeat protein